MTWIPLHLRMITVWQSTVSNKWREMQRNLPDWKSRRSYNSRPPQVKHKVSLLPFPSMIVNQLSQRVTTLIHMLSLIITTMIKIKILHLVSITIMAVIMLKVFTTTMMILIYLKLLLVIHQTLMLLHSKIIKHRVWMEDLEMICLVACNHRSQLLILKSSKIQVHKWIGKMIHSKQM